MDSQVTYQLQAKTAMQKYQAVSQCSTDEMSCELVTWPDEARLSNFLGVITNNATPGQNTTIVMYGIISDPNFSWIANSPIYIGAGGYLTQTMPTSNVRMIGKALGPHVMFVNPSQFFLMNP